RRPSTPAPRTVSSARTTAASPTAGSAMGTTTAGTTRTSPTPPARVRSLRRAQGTGRAHAAAPSRSRRCSPRAAGRRPRVRGLACPRCPPCSRFGFCAGASQEPRGFVPRLSPSKARHRQLLKLCLSPRASSDLLSQPVLLCQRALHPHLLDV
uniref:Uncharacterized protein n=1 Tax=Strix occidentalis caurina TaxID=311401 RepID=A0A8D0FTT3_STROC